jgi:hypothetical protein
MRIVYDSNSESSEHRVRRQAWSQIHSAETYTPERFFTDVGMMLVLLLTLAIVIQLCVYITGS